MKFVVYILFSDSLRRYYVGSTDNFERRIAQHNSGRGGMFTAKGLPWKVIKLVECSSRVEAFNLERKIKKRGIERFLKDLSQ